MSPEELSPQGRRLGMVVAGSLTRGVEVKLEDTVSVEELAVGRYVAIEGERRRFLGMITDVTLATADPRLSITPPDISDPFIARVIRGTSCYGIIHVMPMLTLSGDVASLLEGPQPAKTVPAHFSVVREASERDVELVFGREDERHLYIGTPLDMETKVCLDLQRFVERSNGIFGKSGTGKTFLTRILLMELLQRDAAANLIFDMHNEYGWKGFSEQGYEVKGLKQLFPAKVAVFTLDEENSRRRGVSTDFVVEIGYEEVEPADIEMLRETLNLTERGIDAVYELAECYGQRHWLEEVLNRSERQIQEDLKGRTEIPVIVLRALKFSLSQLKRFKFLVPRTEKNSVQQLLAYLDRKINVVLEFGRYRDNIAAYVLVANMLSRRIHQNYVERKERAIGERATEPTPLVITIEEAHKFLNPQVARQTIFGTIAREMRKYNVTLLVIDQRPSGIDDEVMSQLGTKIACLLDNDRDIEAVLAGVSGKGELKAVLSKLETRQQALIFGHAVPLPVVVRVKDYGTLDSYRELGGKEAGELHRQMERSLEELWE
jgi:hypothetical protein